MTQIIRKPNRLYPLPQNISELDEPHPEIIRARHTRVSTFKRGYDKALGDNPINDIPASTPSNILSKL